MKNLFLKNFYELQSFWVYLSIFIILNIGLFWFIANFYFLITFSSFDYSQNAFHYKPDPQSSGQPFDMIKALGQYDAQWYLKIADGAGYPKFPARSIDLYSADETSLGGLTFAFFPLYPMLIGAINLIINNVELSAFLISQVLMISIFASLYYVIAKLYSQKIALKTSFLLFLFPFSIFLRSYVPESLLLLILIWIGYFWTRHDWLKLSALLGLLNITKGIGIFITLVILCFALQQVLKRKLQLKQFIIYLFLAFTPYICWMFFNYLQTGDPIFFASVRSSWNSPGFYLIRNIFTILDFPNQEFHRFHSSKLDILTIFGVGLILYLSKGRLDFRLWFIAATCWIVPLLVTDTMSYTKYQIISFPIFIYLAQRLSRVWYFLILFLFAISLLVTSLYFVNWHWLG